MNAGPMMVGSSSRMLDVVARSDATCWAVAGVAAVVAVGHQSSVSP